MEDFTEKIANLKVGLAKFEAKGEDNWIGFNCINEINWHYFRALIDACPDYEFELINHSVFKMRKIKAR